MVVRALLVALIAYFLALPLRDIVQYPGRLSVLPNLETDAAAYDGFAQAFAQSGQLLGLAVEASTGLDGAARRCLRG